MFSTLRNVIASTVFLLCVGLASACGSTPALGDVSSVDESEIIGSWRGEDGGAAVLVLEKGGRFSANSLNTSHTGGAGVEVISKELIKGKGEWSLDDYADEWVVNLRFESGGTATLRVATRKRELVLWAYVGDGESSIIRRPESG